MGPLPFGSGRIAAEVETFMTEHGLQWGRSLSEAEGDCGYAELLHALAGFNGAAPFRKRKEGGSKVGKSIYTTCFNGAAPFRKRKGIVAQARDSRSSLASMGPLPFGSGRSLKVESTSGELSRGFNGAAPFRKRKAPTMARR